MVKELRHVDVSGSPDLKRLAEEVAKSGIGVVLRDEKKDLATLLPVKAPRRPRRQVRERTAADVEAFKAAAGSWSDVDTEEIKRWIYEDESPRSHLLNGEVLSR